MYICFDCGELFEEPKHYVETHGLDYPPYETWKGCPVCGGAYDDAMECSICGNYITGDYIEDDGVFVCDNCYEDEDFED